MTLGFALAFATLVSQVPRDTLTYNVAVVPATSHLTVEARLTNASGAPISLALPPAARRAGTTVAGLSATGDRGAPLTARRTPTGFVIEPRGPGAVRFRYRLDVRDSITDGSTGVGLDSTSLYAVTGAVFVAPDPVALRKSSLPYPLVRLAVLPPAGWVTIAGFARDGSEFRPADGDELVGSTLAAAPDFRIYDDSAGGTSFTIAVRGHRYFTDSALGAVVRASLRKSSEALGPVPVARVTYTSALGRKGRSSGSLQGVSSIGLIWEPSELLERARSHDTFHETLHLWFGGAMETARWWTEGVTDYFAARLYSEWRRDPQELAALCFESFRNYERIEHHATLTMAQETRRGMVGDNTELLVYRKGMLAGLLLDAAIRRSSGGHARLDDVARRVLAEAGTRRSHTIRESELRDAVAAVGGGAALRTWDRVVNSTAEITTAELVNALREVTGRTPEVPSPPKRTKVFVGHPASGVTP